MKKTIILIVISLFVITSCKKEDPDMPPFIEPTFALNAGDTLLTIAELKTKFTALTTITNNFYIKGIITSSDESGNVYKALYFQDETGGMNFSIDKSDLYTKFKMGQEIYVKLKNIVYGFYGGAPQIGAMYNGNVGRMNEKYIDSCIFKNKYPANVPTPILINNAADLSMSKVSMLVRLDSAQFADAGQTYSISTATTNRSATLKDGTPIIIRTSNYATFSDSIMPTGRGTIIALLGNFNGDYQLTIRNINDVFGFNSK